MASRYFLLCDPSTGIIIQRLRRPPRLWEMHYCCLELTKAAWNEFRKGETVINRLSGSSLDAWLLNLNRIDSQRRKEAQP